MHSFEALKEEPDIVSGQEMRKKAVGQMVGMKYNYHFPKVERTKFLDYKGYMLHSLRSRTMILMVQNKICKIMMITQQCINKEEKHC